MPDRIFLDPAGVLPETPEARAVRLPPGRNKAGPAAAGVKHAKLSKKRKLAARDGAGPSRTLTAGARKKQASLKARKASKAAGRKGQGRRRAH